GGPDDRPSRGRCPGRRNNVLDLAVLISAEVVAAPLGDGDLALDISKNLVNVSLCGHSAAILYCVVASWRSHDGGRDAPLRLAQARISSMTRRASLAAYSCVMGRCREVR